MHDNFSGRLNAQPLGSDAELLEQRARRSRRTSDPRTASDVTVF